MKKIISMIGFASILCLFPCCKKNDAQPTGPTSSQNQNKNTAAGLFVLIDSEPCDTPMSEYTSATLDIRGVAVFSEGHWTDLMPVAGAWDLVSLQSAPVPVAEITENSTIEAGTITKVKLTFGSNNQLVVGNQPARCYNISPQEVIIDVEAEVEVGTLNQLVLSVDVCGNILVTPRYQDDPCYTLNPIFSFQSFSQVVN